MPHRVVILGGGFGGLHAARKLKKAPVEVKLIDRRNFHLFQPLLYQVATGSLSPGEIASPLRAILRRQRNTRVLLGEVVDLDPDARRVLLRDGAVIEYDTVVVATGSRTSYFGNDVWAEWAPALKTVEQATAMRHKILYAFEAAERASDIEERTAWLTFVIVGGGPTGVELAGALAEIARETLRHDFRDIRPEESRIFILDGAPRVLKTYPENLSKKAEEALVRMGVRVRSGVRVLHVDAFGVEFSNGKTTERLESRTVLWAGGVTSSEFGQVLVQRTRASADRAGRIMVNPDLTLPGHPEIFVIGDQAALLDEHKQALPGVAQVAMQQGDYVADVIAARLCGEPAPRPFRYFDYGDMAVIGRAAAVGRIFGLNLWGLPAWLVWLFVHLMQLVEFSNRVQVFIQWGFQYVTFSRGARLITGPAAADSLTPAHPMKSTAEG